MIEWLRENYMIPLNVVLWTMFIALGVKDLRKKKE